MKRPYSLELSEEELGALKRALDNEVVRCDDLSDRTLARDLIVRLYEAVSAYEKGQARWGRLREIAAEEVDAIRLLSRLRQQEHFLSLHKILNPN